MHFRVETYNTYQNLHPFPGYDCVNVPGAVKDTAKLTMTVPSMETYYE